MVKSCLVETTGWIGDILFSLSLAKKLKEEQKIDRLDYLIDKPQPKLLASYNKYIDNVYLNKVPDINLYDVKYKLPVIESKEIVPTIQFQKHCGIKNLSSEFEIDIPDDLVKHVKENLIKNTSGKKIVSFQGDWDLRFWEIRDDEARSKVFDQTGVYSYYKTLRPGNIKKVIDTLIKEFSNYLFICIDPWHKNGTTDPRGYESSAEHYTTNAAIIKCSDIFLGAEGGLTNLSAGLGVKTIYTTCHMHRMFGANGVMSQSKDIQLGPKKLFPNSNHVAISPYATVEEVIDTIRKELI